MLDLAFKPSDVRLFSPGRVLPLVGLFGEPCLDIAAALFVRACVRKGDAWTELGPEDIGHCLRADVEADVDPWRACVLSPAFVAPHYGRFVMLGYGDYVLDPSVTPLQYPIELTDKAFAILKTATLYGVSRKSLS